MHRIRGKNQTSCSDTAHRTGNCLMREYPKRRDISRRIRSWLVAAGHGVTRVNNGGNHTNLSSTRVGLTYFQTIVHRPGISPRYDGISVNGWLDRRVIRRRSLSVDALLPIHQERRTVLVQLCITSHLTHAASGRGIVSLIYP